LPHAINRKPVAASIFNPGEPKSRVSPNPDSKGKLMINFLPFTYKISIQEAIDWLIYSSLKIEIIDEAWDKLYIALREAGQIKLWEQIDDQAGDRYLADIGWDSENFIVTIYDDEVDGETT
jgi:hypothetical protein